MTIFSRRTTQQALDQLADLVPEAKLRKKINDLNRNICRNDHGKIVADEWEFTVVASFAKFGRVEYERQFGHSDGPALDIYFSGAVDDIDLELLTDVRVVSDADAIAKNPVDEFLQEILAVAAGMGICGGIALKVEGEIVGNPGKLKAKLLLPLTTSIPEYITHHVKPWLQCIAARPDSSATLPQADSHHQFSISYNPTERPYARAGWPSLETPYSINKNPLYNALQSKASKLRDSGWSGLSGVIIAMEGAPH